VSTEFDPSSGSAKNFGVANSSDSELPPDRRHYSGLLRAEAWLEFGCAMAHLPEFARLPSERPISWAPPHREHNSVQCPAALREKANRNLHSLLQREA
jgi:hypothetical protein